MLRSDRVWTLLRAASRAARELRDDAPRAFALAEDGRLVETGGTDAQLAWRPDTGWTPCADGVEDPRLALYLPLCGARPGRRLTIGHLGQSLDGFVATAAGESRSVNGEENIVHLHRLRALCDAVVVGAATVAADDPRLTTRLVDGPNPLRVVLDPRRRLAPGHRLFSDGKAPTLVICDAARAAADNRVGQAELAGVPLRGGLLDPAAVLELLHRRGCHAVFVEGGGFTVSAFLAAGLLDRLHVTVAPLVIGAGRPGLRRAPAARLGDALRAPHRIFRLGNDVLFDFDLRGGAACGEAPGIARVL